MTSTQPNGDMALGPAPAGSGSSSNEVPVERQRHYLASWKERLLRQVLLALAAVHLLGIPYCLLQARDLASCAGVACLGVGHLVLARATRRFDWQLGWLLTATYLELGYVLAVAAWSPSFSLLALLFVGIASTFLERRGLYLAPAAVFVLLVAAGIAVSFGWTFDPERIDVEFPRNWWGAAAIFAALVGLMAYIVHFALNTLASSIGSHRIAQLEANQSRTRLESVRQSRELLEGRVRDAQKLQTVNQLSDGIAHQLSNAITTVRGATELLRQASSTREIHDAAAEVITSVEHTADMVRGLLVFSRRDRERAAPLSLAEELSSLRGTLEETLPASIRLDTRIQSTPVVVVERKRLHQLVLSLVLNGRDAIVGSGSVSLTVDTVEITNDTAPDAVTPLAPGSYATLVVADDGRGMPLEVSARAFEPFFTTKSAQRHEGLGLFVVFGLLRQWGGTLHIDSAPGRGTRITAYLPLASEDSGSEPTPSEPAPSEPAPSEPAPSEPAPSEPAAHDMDRSHASRPATRQAESNLPHARSTAPRMQHRQVPDWMRSSLGRTLLFVSLVYLWALVGVFFMSTAPVGVFHLLLLLAGVAALASWRARSMRHDLRVGVLVVATLVPSAWGVLQFSFMAGAATIGLACSVLFAAGYSSRALSFGVLGLCTGLLAIAPFLGGGGSVSATNDPAVVSHWWRAATLLPIVCTAVTWLLRDLLRAAIRSLENLQVSLDDLGGTRQLLHSEGASLALAELVMERAARVETAGRLASSVAHDLGNSLAAVLGWASLLIDDPAPESSDVETAMLAFDESADYAETLLLQLTARQGDLERAPSDVSKVVRRLQPILTRLVRGNVTIELQVTPGCYAPISPGNFKRALLNLVSNARDAMPKKGTLTISVERFDDRIRVSVADTGVGMDRATRGRLFEAFYTTKTEGHGTGLGLHSVARIMAETGGEISVTSEPGVGSEVTLEWPAAAAPGSASKHASLRPELTHDALVLLAEDDDSVRSVMTRGLLRGGFTVIPAADGDEASAQLRERTDWDALCTDAVMPGRPSAELIRDFLGRFPGRPVLVISGHFEGEITTIAELAEVRFLHKPLGSRDLVAALREELVNASK